MESLFFLWRLLVFLFSWQPVLLTAVFVTERAACHFSTSPELFLKTAAAAAAAGTQADVTTCDTANSNVCVHCPAPEHIRK